MCTPLIMVVDDDDDFREALEEVLLAEGFRVVAAANGEEALRHFRLGVTPNLVLLDLWMPHMDGWQLRRHMEDDPALENIPVVVMTAAHAPDAVGLHVREVIAKPAPIFDIVSVVQRNVNTPPTPP